jgi:APA family basic amino acid/polyamine antiporter
MFIIWMKKEKELSTFKRFILPILAIVACLIMVFAAVYAHGILPYRNSEKFTFPVIFYLIVFAVIMGIGVIFDVLKTKKESCLDKEEVED